MEKQEAAGWAIVGIMLLLLWWLFQYGASLLHGTNTVTTSVQSGIALPGGSQNEPTVTTCTGC